MTPAIEAIKAENTKAIIFNGKTLYPMEIIRSSLSRTPLSAIPKEVFSMNLQAAN